ncbi:DUF3043 domain-containing protein [Corynebacterium confusum]|uniref:DUF3043 domain-containing protein n=1 Tax=uncultured Corynebacterium sp. TaxID=159447 RepID=UPI0025EC7703|nr:DUF3043 domain-containing protein [uncultured Corynebacterium sp.]
MKLPWHNDNQDAAAADTADQSASAGSAAHNGKAGAGEAGQNYPKGYTPPKGRPTPKRADQEIAKGVIRDPHRMSTAQAHQNRKELKKSMSKEEWKDYKAKEREEQRKRNREAQERMAAGDERYLPARDRGKERAYARDVVDVANSPLRFTMPGALALLLFMFVGTFVPSISPAVSAVGMVFILLFAVLAILHGRRVNNAVRVKFPGTTATGFSLGSYAVGRATQPRKWRVPRPRVEPGEALA